MFCSGAEMLWTAANINKCSSFFFLCIGSLEFTLLYWTVYIHVKLTSRGEEKGSRCARAGYETILPHVKTPLYTAVHFLVWAWFMCVRARLCPHLLQTVPEHTWTVPETTFLSGLRHIWWTVPEHGTVVFTLIKWSRLWGQACSDLCLGQCLDSYTLVLLQLFSTITGWHCFVLYMMSGVPMKGPKPTMSKSSLCWLLAPSLMAHAQHLNL